MLRAFLPVVVALAAGCGGGGGARDVTGTLNIDEDFSGGGIDVGAPCEPYNAGAGTQITVKDEEGNIIATGEVTSSDGRIVGGSEETLFDCQVPVRIPGIPQSDFYTFVVEGVDEEQTLSKAQLEQAGWRVALQEVVDN